MKVKLTEEQVKALSDLGSKWGGLLSDRCVFKTCWNENFTNITEQ